MANTVYSQVIDISNVDLRWMVGRTIASVSMHEAELSYFEFSGGGYVHTQDVWRILTADRMLVSSADHGHQFGLPARLDAPVAAMAALANSPITEARIDTAAPDLLIRFANGTVLQVLTLSMGYECWTVCDPSRTCFVVHGSRHAQTWKEPERS